MTSIAKRISSTGTQIRESSTAQPRELISGVAATGPLAQVQAYLAVGAALTGAVGALLPHPPYFNVAGLLAVQALALAYGITVLALRKRISYSFLRLGNLFAAVLTTAAVYFSGDSASGYAIFYLWIGFYVFYYPVSRLEAALVIVWGVINYAVAIAITPVPAVAGPHADIHFFAIVVGTLVTAGALLSYLRHRNERLVTRLVEASRTDPLTELANRVGLHHAIEREIERGHADMRPVSLLILDVDRFKQINERFGIGGGDEVLKRLAKLMSDSTRLIDTLARSGGEEFAIL